MSDFIGEIKKNISWEGELKDESTLTNNKKFFNPLQ